jgi:hypothetical protein
LSVLELENNEKTGCTFLDRQLGHTTLPVATSISMFSNLFPHFLQTYSLIGNLHTS